MISVYARNDPITVAPLTFERLIVLWKNGSSAVRMEFAVLPSAAIRTKTKQEDPVTESVTNNAQALLRLWSQVLQLRTSFQPSQYN